MYNILYCITHYQTTVPEIIRSFLNTKCTDDRGAFTESNYQELSVLGLNVMITIIKLSLLHFAMYIELSLKAHKTVYIIRPLFLEYLSWDLFVLDVTIQYIST
jgi:hypothetical protein